MENLTSMGKVSFRGEKASSYLNKLLKKIKVRGSLERRCYRCFNFDFYVLALSIVHAMSGAQPACMTALHLVRRACARSE